MKLEYQVDDYGVYVMLVVGPYILSVQYKTLKSIN